MMCALWFALGVGTGMLLTVGVQWVVVHTRESDH